MISNDPAGSGSFMVRLDLLIKTITFSCVWLSAFLLSRLPAKSKGRSIDRATGCAHQRRRRRDGRGGQGLRRGHWCGTRKRSCRSDPFLLYPDRHFATSRPDETSHRVSTRRYFLNLCKDLFTKWSSVDESCFTIEIVSGGITNLLLKVSIRENNGNINLLTVRLYGLDTDLVIDRKRELQALPHLSAAGFGAKLLGISGNGMVQSFLDARTLSPSDMSIPEIASEIARQLHKFHKVAVPGSTEPQLWNDLFRFLDKAAALKYDDSGKQARYESIPFQEIRAEISKLKDLTALLNAPVVFAHNDLLSGNLMINDKEGRLYFIDFEYGSYSYRGYDIANHFNEYAGFDCDFSLYPDKEAQYHFFSSYLEPQNPHKVPDHDLEALFVETNTFRLASHIYWALWAIIQAKVSSIDFDYLSYFFLRYNEYKKQREACFSIAQDYLSRLIRS